MYLNIPWYYFIFISGSRYADGDGSMFVEDCWVIVVRNVPIFYDILGVFIYNIWVMGDICGILYEFIYFKYSLRWVFVGINLVIDVR